MRNNIYTTRSFSYFWFSHVSNSEAGNIILSTSLLVLLVSSAVLGISLSLVKLSLAMVTINLKAFLFLLQLARSSTATTERIDPSFLEQLLDNLSTHTLFTVLSTISLISLIFVFIIYLFIYGFNSLYSKIILSNVISTSLLTIFFLVAFNNNIVNDDICKIIGYFGYFSAMSMLSWMTLLSFHLFCLMQGYFQCTSSFMLYSAIGWGSGLVLTILLFTLDNILPHHSDFHPGMGYMTCFISTAGNKLLFLFHVPTLIIMLINLSFFLFIIGGNINNSKKIEQPETAQR